MAKKTGNKRVRKLFLSPKKYYNMCFKLARQIYEHYKPDIIVAIWRGGSTPGMVVHEYLNYMGVKTEHTVVKTSSYTGIGKHDKVDIDLFPELEKRIKKHKNVLFIDDIFDSGKTVEAIRKTFGNVKIATVLYKEENEFLPPDFYVKRTKKWVVFPHELDGLKKNEVWKKGLRFIKC